VPPVGTFADRTFYNQSAVVLTAGMMNATFAHPTDPGATPPTGNIVYTITQAPSSYYVGRNPVGTTLSPRMSPFTVTANYVGDANYLLATVSAVFRDVVQYTPTAPGGLDQRLLGPTSFGVSWQGCGGFPAQISPAFSFDVSLDNGATTHLTVTDSLSAVVNGRNPSTTYVVRVRGRDEFGNVSGWSDPLSLTTLAAGMMPIATSSWIATTDSGLLDEVIDGGTPAFSYSEGTRSTEYVTYTTWIETWIYIPGFSYSDGGYYSEGGYDYYVPGQWMPDWEMVEETVEVEVLTPVFQFVAEPGYDYRIARRIARGNGGVVIQPVWESVLTQWEPADGQGGIHSWFPSYPWSEPEYFTFPFVLVRYGFAPGGCVVNLPRHGRCSHSRGKWQCWGNTEVARWNHREGRYRFEHDGHGHLSRRCERHD